MKKAIKISILSTLIVSSILSIVGYSHLSKEQIERIKKVKLDKLKYKGTPRNLSPEDIEFLKRVKENRRKRQSSPETFIVNKKTMKYYKEEL